MYVVKTKNLVLKGTRNAQDRLWELPLHYTNPLHSSYQQQQQPIHSSIYPKNSCVALVSPIQSYQYLSPSESASFTIVSRHGEHHRSELV